MSLESPNPVLTISRGKTSKPPRILIYGAEKIGKSVEEAVANVLGAARAEEAKLLEDARNVILKARTYEKEVVAANEDQIKLLYEDVINKIEKLKKKIVRHDMPLVEGEKTRP